MVLNKRVVEFAVSANPDATLIAHLGAAVTTTQRTPRLAKQPGEPLRLLLAGYLGAGNVGSEMRSNEIVRQVRHLLGEQPVEVTALAVSERLPDDVLQDIRMKLFEGYLPDTVVAAVEECDGVIACEGSMFKSTFSDVLSAIMAGALGMASRQGKLAVGYGAEVGAMEPDLRAFVADYAKDASIYCRNEASLQEARKLGLRAFSGADTAWSFTAAPVERAEELLRSFGWNGRDPILALCPTNPFWWPVKANPGMALAMQRTGAHKELSYGSVFFHAHSDEIDRRYRRYIQQFGAAAAELAGSMGAFPLLIAMERVDETACRDLAREIGGAPAMLVGSDYRVGEVVALLRRANLLISSRFHALVASLPGLVPSIGVATDERIRNLLSDSDASERLVSAADPDFAEKIVAAAGKLDAAQVADSARRTVANALRGMGEMGLGLAEELRGHFPELNIAERSDWQSCLPPLSAQIQSFL